MAKTKSKTVKTVEDVPNATLPEITTTAKVKKVEIGITKYFQLANPPIHKYTRAALEVQFHGIMNSESGWAETLIDHTEGV